MRFRGAQLLSPLSVVELLRREENKFEFAFFKLFQVSCRSLNVAPSSMRQRCRHRFR
jgi:hypothetical protein